MSENHENTSAAEEVHVDETLAASESLDSEAGSTVESEIHELTADLQRLQADYANYRKRVDRDRALARENAIGDVLAALLPVLDDFGRAREHGELTGAFKSVSDAVDAVVQRFGLEVFGAVGEDFDPAIHEALTHQTTDAEGETTTVVTSIYQVGFKHAGRVLRPARVGVEDIARLHGSPSESE
jgi:molecular chaperone GrpE